MARIEGYTFGRVVVDGVEHRKDLIVLPGRVVSSWWRREGHSVDLDDLADVLGDLPERLVLGTGADGRMRPRQETLAALEDRGVQVEVLTTPRAVRRYAELDPERAAAALHLTC